VDQNSVLSKTGRGLLQIKYKSYELPKDQYRVLRMIDGKRTFRDLTNSSIMNEVSLRSVLQTLADGGFIREISTPYADADSYSMVKPRIEPENDLDFTRSLGAKAQVREV
jgi:hypothetical protein